MQKQVQCIPQASIFRPVICLHLTLKSSKQTKAIPLSPPHIPTIIKKQYRALNEICIEAKMFLL